MRTSQEATIEGGDHVRTGVWWYEEQPLRAGVPIPAYGAGWVVIDDALRLVGSDPETLREVGQACLAAADQLAAAYAEHGVRPPSAGTR